jgi:hypothetical protein
MGVSFLPSTELDLLSWSANFAAKVAGDPAFWGVSVEQSDAFVALQTNFAESIRVASDPSTRTRGNVIVKNQCDAALRVAARQLAKVIDGQPDVTDSDRSSLGLTVRAARTTSSAPATRPLLSAALRDGRTVTLTLHDTGPSNGRRLPPGVFGAILFRAVGEVAPVGRDGWQFLALTGRTTLDVFCDKDVPPGAQVWFTAAWFNHRKKLSPSADPVSIHLAGGPVIQLGLTTLRRAA